MISITSVRVSGFSRRFLDVDWEIAPTHDDLQEWQFYVERSEAEAGPWEVIAGPLIDRFHVKDNTAPQISVNRKLFYRIRAENPTRSKVLVSEARDREGPADLIAEEIASLEALLFEEFVGTIAWLFPVRTFGQRCPQCWDRVLGKRTSDQCPTCYGTGFSGGYHYPIEFWPQWDASPSVQDRGSHFEHEQTTTTLRCAASPYIKPDDVIIDHKNQRFRVVKAGSTARLGTEVHREVSVLQLQPGSVVDQLELKVDGRNLIHAAERNFTNARSLSSASGAVPSTALDALLGSYGFNR